MARHTSVCLSKWLLILWIIAEFCCNTATFAASVSKITPNWGGIAGDTRLTIDGSGFSSDQYKFGNEVYLIGTDTGGQYPCLVHKIGTTERRIMCYTPGNIPQQKYYVKVIVDGRAVPDSNICGSNPILWDQYWSYDTKWCHFSPVSYNTPSITSFTPQSDVPGQQVTIHGHLFTDRYGSNTPTASNGRTQRLLRVYAGPADCELKKDNDTYSLALDNGNKGQLTCRTKGRSIGVFNASFNVESPYGRSLVSPELYRLSYKDDIYLYQIYTNITSLSSNRGSTAGGLELRIYGFYFDNRPPNAQPKATLHDSECVITNVVLDEYVECIVPAKPQYDDARFPGNRGVILEHWTSTTKLDLDSILELSSSSPGYTTKILDETHFYETNMGNCASKMTTFFTPPHSGRYRFQLESKNNRARVFLNSDPSGTTQYVELKKGQRYLLEVVHQATSGDSFVHLSAFFADTRLTNSQIGKAKQEKQHIGITSRRVYEEQELTFSNFDIFNNLTNQTYTAEVQVVEIYSYGQFRFGLYGVYTELLDFGTASSLVVEQAFNSLPVLLSDEHVTVERIDTSLGVSFTFTFASTRGDFPDIEVLFTTDTKQESYQIKEIVKGSTYEGQVSLTLAGRVSEPFNVSKLSATKLSAIVSEIFVAKCPDVLERTAKLYLDFENNHGYQHTDAFCGRSSIKNPGWISVYRYPLILVSQYRKLCFAHKGVFKNTIRLHYKYRSQNIVNDFFHSFSKDSTISSWSWFYTCFDLYDNIHNLHQDDREYHIYRMKVSKGTLDDILVDSLYIGTGYGITEDMPLRRQAPALANNVIIDRATISENSDVFKITFIPSNCGYNFPLIQLTNAEVTKRSISSKSSSVTFDRQNGGTLHVERTATASPPIQGVMDVTFNGTTKYDLNLSLSDEAFQRELETIPNIGSLTVTKTDRCDYIHLAVQFDSLPGDLPQMSVALKPMSGIDVSYSVSTVVDGGFLYDPLTGDMLSTVHSKPQVILSMNSVPSACAGDCSFEWDENYTPTVTAASPASGTLALATTLVIGGSGFSLTAEYNVVTIGGVGCEVTSVTDTAVTCNVGNGPIGQHKIDVTVSYKGHAIHPMGDIMFEYTGNISMVSPTTGGLGGGLLLTLTGYGFQNGATVTINTKYCDVVSYASDKLTCILPAQDSGGRYAVIVSNGQSSLTFNEFHYDPALTPIVSSLLPSIISVSGGKLTIHGSGFGNPGYVKVGDESAVIVSWTDQSIVVDTGSLDSGIIYIKVETRHGKALLRNNSLPAVYVDLCLTSVCPSNGSVAGGTYLTITGSGFGKNVSTTSVTVGNVPCDISAMNNTHINCTIATTAQVHNVTNQGIHRAFGVYYAFDEQHLKIKLNDIVNWSWRTPAFVNDIHHTIIEVASLNSTEAKSGGFSSGPPSRNGTFQHQFTKTGLFYVWSGFVDDYIIKNYYGTIEVVNIESFMGEVEVNVSGKRASYRNEGPLDPIETSTCQSVNSTKTDCSDDLPTGRNLNTLQFAFLNCRTPFVYSVSPRNGTVQTAIKIQGEGFSAINRYNEVYIGESRCNVTTSSEDSITCYLMKLSTPKLVFPHPVTIRVTDRGYAILKIWNSINRSFAVVPNIENIYPSNGSLAGGDIITVTGFGLGFYIIVDIDGYVCEMQSNTFTAIQCQTPPALSQGSKELRVFVFIDEYPFQAICEVQTNTCEYNYTSALTPSLSSISPIAVYGPTTLTITGTHLGTITSSLIVNIGTVVASVMTASDTEITIEVQNLPVGNNEVCVRRIGYGNATGSLAVSGIAKITSIAPSYGSINGGQQVTVKGHGFLNGHTTVTLGENVCGIRTISLTSVVFLTPPHQQGPVALKLTCNDVVFDEETYMYRSDVTPTITYIEPASGLPGISLTIIGSNFGDDAPTVLLGDTFCSVTSNTDSEIRCVVGHHVTGSVPVLVHVTSFGASNSNINFEYELALTSISPTHGSLGGGQSVTLTGSGFTSTTKVKICNKPCTFVSATASTFVCITLPLSSQLCDVMVSLNGLTRRRSDAYTYDTTITPTVINVNPVRGGTGGGTSLTISGSGFGSSLAHAKVQIADAECVIRTLTDTKITCDTGPHLGCIQTRVHVEINGNGIAVELNPGDAFFEYIDVWSSKFTWGGGQLPAAGEIVVIQTGQTVLLDTTTPVIKVILIQGGKLIFDEVDIGLNAEIIMITDGGLLQVGTENEPFQHKAVITLHGHVRSKGLPIYGTKVLALRNGTLELHGKDIPLTWTYLAATANVGSANITLVHRVEWLVGDEIVIATTGHRHSQRENEKRRITNVSGDNKTLTLDIPLTYKHIGTQETVNGTIIQYRAEVGRLTRNVVVRGNSDRQWENYIASCEAGFDTGHSAIQTCFRGRHGDEIGSSQFGAVIMVHPSTKSTIVTHAKLSQTEITFAGQAFRLGRYAVYFYLNNDMSTSYINGCSIHHTFNRAVDLQGVHMVTVERSVLYDIMGSAVVLEDGGETGNIVQYNLAVFVRQSTSLQNDDITPAAFFITHPNNTIRHNAAAGGTHFGFWYYLSDHPDGPSYTTSVCSKYTTLGMFFNNSAHSLGWYGLWIYPIYVPRENPCYGSVLETVVFHTFFAWNNDIGTEIVHGGAIQFDNFTLALNLKAGFKGHLFECAPVKTEIRPMIRNSLIIGSTNMVLKSSEQGCTRVGVVLPTAYGFHLKNVRFVNFADKSCKALSFPSGNLRSRYKYITEQLIFINSPNKGIYTFQINGGIVDLDETLFDVSSFPPPIPTTELLPSSCINGSEFSNGVPYSKCPSAYTFSKYVLTAGSYSRKTLTLQNKYGNTTVPYDGGWSGYILSREAYNFTFENADTFINFSMNFFLIDFGEPDFLFIRLPLRELPDRLSVNGNIRSYKLPSSKPLDAGNASHGDWEWLNKERMVNVFIRGSRSSSRTMNCEYDLEVKLLIYKCFYTNCITPPNPETIPPVNTTATDHFFWGDTKIWTNTSDCYITADKNRNGVYGLPRNNDNVRIPSGMWIVINEVPVNKIGTLLIEGILEILDIPGLHYEVTATYIVILGGRLIAGWPYDPFDKAHLSIILSGTHSTDVCLKWHDTRLGPKAIDPDETVPAGAVSSRSSLFTVVFGGLDLYGNDIGRTWTQLAITAEEGTKKLVLKEAVKWIVGDEIVIGPTSYDAMQTESSKIKEVTKNNVTTLILERPLEYKHIAFSDTFNGRRVNCSAPVGLLSRNIKIVGGEYQNSNYDKKGARVFVGVFKKPERTYTGYASLSNVEFRNTGQKHHVYTDGRYFSLAYVDTGTVSSIKPSFVKNCSFTNGLNTAIGAQGVNNLNITGNVIFDSTGSGISTNSNDTNIVHNLIALVKIAGSYGSGIDASQANRVVLHNNLVTGAMQIGINAPPQECWDDSACIANNTVQANAIGYGVLSAAITQTCSNILSLTAWKNIIGIYYQAKAPVKIANHTLIENGIGIITFVIGPDARKHLKGNKTVEINNTLIVGITSSFDCESDMKNWKISSRIQGVAAAVVSPSMKMVGVVFPNFMSGPNGAPLQSLIGIKTPPAIVGLMKLSNVTFANYGSKYCSAGYAIATNIANDDGQHPIESVNTTLIDVDDANKIRYQRPNLARVNPGDCVDMDCDGLKKTLFKDLDGTFLGAVGSVIPESEFNWDGDPRRGLGYYRIPKPMVTALNGTRIPYHSLMPNRGIVRSTNCTYKPDWQAYSCFDYNYEMLIIESMDSDSQRRRISPVALLSESYVDLINGPQDHTLCYVYACRQRLSTFMAIVATGLEVLVYFTGTTPRHMRYHLLNVQPNQGVKLTVWYANPSRLDVYVRRRYVIPTNSYINSRGYYVSKLPVGEEFTPMVDNATGTNYFDRRSGQHSVIIKGQTVIDIKTANVIIVSFGLPAMSVDDFYGANLVENIAAFLDIPLTNVRIVNIVRATGTGRRRRSTKGMRVDLEIGNEPNSELTENSTASDRSDREAILSMTAQTLNECQIGNISETLNMETFCESITSSASTTGYETITYSPQIVSRLVFLEKLTTSYEGNLLHNQPNIQLLDVLNVVITDLGTTEYPWQLTVGIRPGTGNPDAVLTGQTTINASNSWFNFTELAITHMGSGYVLDFNISYPEVESQFSQSSPSFDVKSRLVKANALTMTSGNVQPSGHFDVALELVDTITEQIIPAINWRNHSWNATMALLETPQFGTIDGPTTNTFNHTTGLCTFNNLSISHFGFYYIQFRIESTPVEYNFTVNHKVWIRNPDFVDKTPEARAVISIKFDVDFDTVLPDEDAMNKFDQFIMENFTNDFSSVEFQSSSVNKGSIVVTFSIAGNQSDVSTVMLSLCDSVNRGTSYVFYGNTLSLAKYMTYNDQMFYGVSCHQVDDNDSLDIAAIAVGSALLFAIIAAGVIVWIVRMNKVKQVAGNVATIEVCEANASNVDSSVLQRTLSAGSVRISLPISMLEPIDNKLPLFDNYVAKPRMHKSKVSPAKETNKNFEDIQTPTPRHDNDYPSWATVNKE